MPISCNCIGAGGGGGGGSAAKPTKVRKMLICSRGVAVVDRIERKSAKGTGGSVLVVAPPPPPTATVMAKEEEDEDEEEEDEEGTVVGACICTGACAVLSLRLRGRLEAGSPSDFSALRFLREVFCAVLLSSSVPEPEPPVT